tara:strand:- start:3073 stop:3345 length:273 start_codon:yes stop_codon:yes gene_type:complete
MALIDKIKDTKFGYGGADLPKFGDTAKASKLHNEYSLNGNPEVLGKPEPSEFDLNGINPLGALKDPKTPSINNTFSKGTYKNNLPGGASL